MNYTEFVQYLLLTIAVVLTVINVFSFHEGELAIPAFLAWLGFAFLTGAMTLAGLGLWLTIGFLWSLVRWGLICEEYKSRTEGTVHAKDWQYLSVGDFAGGNAASLFVLATVNPACTPLEPFLDETQPIHHNSKPNLH